jgi:hypothetical protein
VVRDFYPSLYLNMGKSHEDLGNRDTARHFYELAATPVDCLPHGKYGKVVHDAIEKALHRLRE